jgi:hypothetical protein
MDPKCGGCDSSCSGKSTHRRLWGGGRSAGAGSGRFVLLAILRRRLLLLLRLLAVLPILAVGGLRVLSARRCLVSAGRLLRLLLLRAIRWLACGHSGGLVGVGGLAARRLLLRCRLVAAQAGPIVGWLLRGRRLVVAVVG